MNNSFKSKQDKINELNNENKNKIKDTEIQLFISVVIILLGGYIGISAFMYGLLNPLENQILNIVGFISCLIFQIIGLNVIYRIVNEKYENLLNEIKLIKGE